MSSFDVLNAVNVSDKTEKKNGLTYLSWPIAWGEFKKHYPDSYYTVYENPQGYNYFTDGRTCWVKTGVTLVDGDKSLELVEYLPVMDYKNKSISANAVTSYDVNKSIQRSLTKAIARHGLGLYIYAGEDLPEEKQTPKAAAKTEEPQKEKAERAEEKPEEHRVICECCGSEITDCEADGKKWTRNQIIRSGMKFNQHLCYKCLAVVAKQEAAKKALLADAEAHSA